VVFIHGVGLDLTMWDLVVPDLAVDRRVVRYDLWGHGNTPDPAGPRTLDDFAVQCVHVLSAVTSGSPVGEEGMKPDLVGLSLGGLIALTVASRHPAAMGRLVAMNAVFDRTDEQALGSLERLALTEAEGLGPVADLAVDRWFAPDWQDAHPDRVGAVRDRLVGNDLEAYLKAYRVFIDGDPAMPGAAAAVTAPTLALTGELDVGSTPSMSHAIAAAVTDGRSRVLSGLRHLLPIEAPEATVAALHGFLDGPITRGPREDAR